MDGPLSARPTRRRRRLRGASLLTPSGHAVAALGIATLGLARWWGYVEALAITVACGLVLVMATPFLLYPGRVSGRLRLAPPRGVAGGQVTARTVVDNRGVLPFWSPGLMVPLHGVTRQVDLPVVAPRGSREAAIVVPTPRRGVYTLGPVQAWRTDPLGLLRRRLTLVAERELYVLPRTVALESFEWGLVPDPDGVPSDRVSMSDLSFHGLREYVPGDELRHVHWKSSARAGQLLVRQYHDSRRSRATFVLDVDPAAYDSDDDFELAVSVLASLLARAGQDAFDLSLVAGRDRHDHATTDDLLAACCRVQPSAVPLGEALAAARAASHDGGMAMLVSGARLGVEGAAAALRSVGEEPHSRAILAAVGEQPSRLVTRGGTVHVVGDLSVLPAVLGEARP